MKEEINPKLCKYKILTVSKISKYVVYTFYKNVI